MIKEFSKIFLQDFSNHPIIKEFKEGELKLSKLAILKVEDATGIILCG